MKDIENNINVSSENINEEVLEETNIIKNSSNENSESNTDELNTTENKKEIVNNESSTDLIEYKEIEEPCVALTIIGENKLTNTEIFIKRGVKFSIKAFFSGIILTIMNLFIWKTVSNIKY